MNLKDALLSRLGVKNTQASNGVPDVQGKGSLSRISINFAQSSPISLQTLKYIRDNDENVNLAANSIAEAVAGNGFELFIEGSNKDGSPLSDQIKEKAQDYCRQFAYNSDLDTFNLETIAEYVSVGVSFTEKLYSPIASISGRKELVKLGRLPIDDSWQIKLPEKTGGPDFVTAKQGSSNVEFTPDELMLWRFNRTSTSDWYGRGLCWYMAQEKSYTLEYSDGSTKDYKVPPLYVILWALKDDLRLVMHNATPKTFINAPGQSDAWVSTYSELIAKTDPGVPLLLNAKQGIEVETAQSDPRFRVDALLNWYDQVLLRTLQAPSMAIYSKEGYSGVFAEQVLNQFARKITALKRYHARRLEREIFAPVLDQNGIDSKYVRPRIYWRPDIKMISQLQDYVALFTNEITSQDFTPDERRAIYRQYGASISGTAPARVQTQTPQQKPAQPTQPAKTNAPADDTETE